MYCPNCKKDVETEKYCIYCGADLAPDITTEELQIKEPVRGRAEDKPPEKSRLGILAGIGAIVVAAIYTILPVDIIPDLTPILGFLDDLGIDAVAILFAIARFIARKKKK
ncbi:MAG: DUF1232 domain-containing protein [Clostridia bacterium]|nr:DUF1232 domain-containing protein [Clostridia bacterium]